MAKVEKAIDELPEPETRDPAPRYAVYFIDQVTQVQIGAATDDLEKFTKTDLMKMVEAFKEGVETENAKWGEGKQNAPKSNKRGDSAASKRIRRARKVREQ